MEGPVVCPLEGQVVQADASARDDPVTANPAPPGGARGVYLKHAGLFAALAPVVLLAVMGVASCSGSAVTGDASSGAVATTGQSSPFAHVGAVPGTVDGAAFDPASLTGKPVVLWFWAPWCTVCRGEAPTVRKVAAEFAGAIEFVGVAGQGSKVAMADFVRETGTGDLTHLADTSGNVWREYGVAVQPSFAFITRDGRADIRVGSLEERTLRALVAEIVAGAATSTVTFTPGETCSKAPDGTFLCGSAGPGQPLTTIPPSPTSPP